MIYYCVYDPIWTGYITRIQATTTKAGSIGNIVNVMKGLMKCSGADPSLLEEWYEKLGTLINLPRPEIFYFMEG